MFHIFILNLIDETGFIEDWMKENTRQDHYHIVFTEQQCENLSDDLKNYTDTDIDFFFIFVIGDTKIIQTIKYLFHKLGIQDEKVIFPLIIDELQHYHEISRYLFKGSIQHLIDYYYECTLHDYSTCTTKEGLSYIGESTDGLIIRHTYMTKDNWAEKEICTFFELSCKYYPKLPLKKEKWFLDIGANIGTTSVYVKK